jgi:UDP-N-acetyl-D-mannosaminuronate dehydrogenase
MKHLIIGLGQVGTALYNNYCDSGANAFGWDIRQNPRHTFEKYTNQSSFIELPQPSIIHICFPYSDTFENTVIEYINEIKPDYTIIHSTVKPGTTSAIFYDLPHNTVLIYSNVHGQHDKLYDALRVFPKIWARAGRKETINDQWFGDKQNEELLDTIDRIFREGQMIDNRESELTTTQLEVIKLLDTGQYSALITWAHVEETICEKYDIKHEQLRELRKPIAMRCGRQRPIIYPGGLGGHCLRPNLDLLWKIWIKTKTIDNPMHELADGFLGMMTVIDNIWQDENK